MKRVLIIGVLVYLVLHLIYEGGEYYRSQKNKEYYAKEYDKEQDFYAQYPNAVRVDTFMYLPTTLHYQKAFSKGDLIVSYNPTLEDQYISDGIYYSLVKSYMGINLMLVGRQYTSGPIIGTLDTLIHREGEVYLVLHH